MWKLAWAPLFSGVTVEKAEGACPPRNVIALQSAIHASFS
jgi:hypothetical protein